MQRRVGRSEEASHPSGEDEACLPTSLSETRSPPVLSERRGHRLQDSRDGSIEERRGATTWRTVIRAASM